MKKNILFISFLLLHIIVFSQERFERIGKTKSSIIEEFKDPKFNLSIEENMLFTKLDWCQIVHVIDDNDICTHTMVFMYDKKIYINLLSFITKTI